MDYLQIIIEGYFKKSTHKILDKYVIRKYKEAREKHFSYDEFFNGCLDVSNSLYAELDNSVNKRKHDLYNMINWSQQGMKGSNDIPKEPTEKDFLNIKTFEKELNELSSSKFNINLLHFSNGHYRGYLEENDVNYIEQAIRKAMESELMVQENPNNNKELKKPSIPDVILFANTMNNSAFGNILLKHNKDGKENSHYHKNLFENWATIRINEFTTSNQFGKRTNWMKIFINLYCEHLISLTIKIATGAHLNFKNEQKWESKYNGFINLFHFLDYGSGHRNTIGTILTTLKLNWDEDPLLATKMQSYCIDRITELKKFVEVNYFIKKENPIFIWYDEIINRLRNTIDFKETELRLSENNRVYLHPTPLNGLKTRILNSIESTLFFQFYTDTGNGEVKINESITLDNWESLKTLFFQQRIERSNPSYTSKEKIKYELIVVENLSINNEDHSFLKDRYKTYLLELLEDLEGKKIFELQEGLERKEVKTDIPENQKNPYPEIFKDVKAYNLFVKLFNDYKESKNPLADFSFVYRKMHSDKLIKSYYRPEMFREWISKEPFCIILDNGLKTLDRCQTTNKKINYDTSKTIIA